MQNDIVAAPDLAAEGRRKIDWLCWTAGNRAILCRSSSGGIFK